MDEKIKKRIREFKEYLGKNGFWLNLQKS